MIEIIKGHDSSSYFWIRPVRFKYEKIETFVGDYWDLVEEYKEKEISIEETIVESFLYYFLKKYFDSSFEPNIKRDEIRNLYGECISNEPVFEWHLEYNFYTFENIENMILDIKQKIKLLINDYDSPVLDKLKENYDYLLYSIRYARKDNLTEMEKRYIIKENIHEIIEFYYRFIFYLEDMMEAGKKNGYNLISFMGP